MGARRAAHFLLNRELATSPPNEALISIYLDCGYEVDVFAPGALADVSAYGSRVRAQAAEYGYRWIAANAFSPRWLGYSAFSCTTEDPAAVSGMLARLYRRPHIVIADEIRSGSYAGNRSRRWKQICRFGLRSATLTVVNEELRIPLQRDYAGLPADAPIIVYPGCFRIPPPPGDRAALREARGLPRDAFVLCYSGLTSYGGGGHWLAEAMGKVEDLWVLGQIPNLDPLTRELLRRLRGSERLVLEERRLGWREAWSSMAAIDVGMVVYLSDAPQFCNMGIASNRLCMFLSMGVPVIASRQPSFQFIEDYGCGVLVERMDDVPDALRRIRAQQPQMAARALDCAREYIRAPERYVEWRDAVRRVLDG
jgi:glycosyltransferase involved in cell wall biosynthesis